MTKLRFNFEWVFLCCSSFERLTFGLELNEAYHLLVCFLADDFAALRAKANQFQHHKLLTQMLRPFCFESNRFQPIRVSLDRATTCYWLAQIFHASIGSQWLQFRFQNPSQSEQLWGLSNGVYAACFACDPETTGVAGRSDPSLSVT